MAFARHQFELSKPVEGDGEPIVNHLRAQWKKTGIMPEMLANAPPCPPSCDQLWQDFLALHGSRGSSGFGVARITFADMAAYQKVTGSIVNPWEIEAIRKIDDLWLADFAPKPKETK